MARIRSIKPEFFTSLTVGERSLHARLTFIGLWTHCDDEGRCVDDARLIRAAIWPLDDRAVSDVDKDLAELHDSDLIVRYEIAGRAYVQVSGWDEHQVINKPKPSKLPTAPCGGLLPDPSGTDTGHVRDDDGTSTSRKGTGRGAGKGREQGGGDVPATSGTQRTTRASIPTSDFKITPSLKAWAHGKGIDDESAKTETAKWLDWCAANGRAYKDQAAGWRTWMTRSIEYAAEHREPIRVNGHRPNAPSTTDQRVNAGLALVEKYRGQEAAS